MECATDGAHHIAPKIAREKERFASDDPSGKKHALDEQINTAGDDGCRADVKEAARRFR